MSENGSGSGSETSTAGGLLKGIEGAVDGVLDMAEHGAESTVKAFTNAGASAEEAEAMTSGSIPGVREVVSGAEAVGHGIAALGDLLSGDTKEATNEGLDALDAAGKFISSVGKDAEDLAPEASEIPGVGEVVSAGATVIHGGIAVADLLSGDTEGATDHFASALEGAGNALTFGGLGLAEAGVDLINAGAGGGESTSAHHMIMAGVHALGDLGSSLFNGDGSGPADPGASGSASSAESSSGGDPGAYAEEAPPME